MAEGRSFMPFKHRHFSNSLAASQLQNLTMFEGLKNLPFEHKTMPFEQKTLPFEHLERCWGRETDHHKG